MNATIEAHYTKCPRHHNQYIQYSDVYCEDNFEKEFCERENNRNIYNIYGNVKFLFPQVMFIF